MYFVPYYADFFPVVHSPFPGYVASAPPPAPPPPPPAPARRIGVLQLDLEGADRGAQVHVDGYFVGTLGDFNDQLALEFGPHQIEVRASGYAPLVFDVKVADDRPITYRDRLTPLSARVPAEPVSKPATTIYFIPGCYLGNLPPSRASLPATCDISQLSTYKP